MHGFPTRGMLHVRFQNKITEGDARNFIASHGLHAGAWTESIKLLSVQVPDGQELRFKKIFEKSALVKKADQQMQYSTPRVL